MSAKLNINSQSLKETEETAIKFCRKFEAGNTLRYIFGKNLYAESIARTIDVDGFVDDFTQDTEFLGKPVIKTEGLPKNSMAVSAVVLGRPLTARKKLQDRGIENLDYYSFRKYSGTEIMPVLFMDEFKATYKQNEEKVDWLYGLLSDEVSKEILERIVCFRLSENIDYMEGFTDCQDRQYFENFLGLKSEGEVFVDVGGYDGYTSEEFIKRCPGHDGVHIFEPEPANFKVIQKRFGANPRVQIYPLGLSDRAQTLHFQSQGSASRVTEKGDIEIKVDRLDALLKERFTFLKMDVEGSEIEALSGAKKAIKKHLPRLAISAYHRYNDFWKIPELILSFNGDYKIFLRHYTEGITETVMFFIPPRIT